MSTNHEFGDIGYYVVAEFKDYYVDFKIYKLMYTDAGRTMFQSDNGVPVPLEQAIPDITGSVKFDHCSNWATRPDVMLHGCTRQDLVNVGEVLARCHDIAATMPKWMK